MTSKFFLTLLAAYVAVAAIPACKKAGSTPLLSLTNHTDTIAATGGTKTINFTSDGAWSIDTSGLGWVKISPVSGSSGNAAIQITVADTNASGAARSRLLYVGSSSGQGRRITVYQYALIYPTYNVSPIAPDASGMGSTSAQLIAKMNLGTNIGNTLELNNIEPYPTLAYIQFLKQTGFNAVRLPCGWYLHGGNNPTARIPKAWMDSVKQVVQWCVSNDMYVMLNIHWDGGWLEGPGNAASSRKDSVQARQKAYWEQIATAMRDFDEHLLFASANEPFNVSDGETAKNLVSYHQACIDAVRSTGGRNTYRTIAIQGPDAYIKPGAYFPTDATPNRLAFEFHNYTPSNFAILDQDPLEGGWGYIFYYWGAGNHSTIDSSYRNATYGEEADRAGLLHQIKSELYRQGYSIGDG
ncbi:cellulase family glycosylhydrolase [Puia sp. P3]|uniref:cellulase family glycosylhydrolase n=1 Tax=Puia sp. P3 TaxID=3423952 RepID=UPI003D66534F